MTISRLAQYFERLEQTTLRNEITQILAEVFKEATVQEIDKIAYLALGELLPAYRGLEFNIAEKLMIQIFAVAYATTPEKVAKLYKAKGDLGDAGEELAETQPSKQQARDASVSEVYERLQEVAREAGEGSQGRKIQKMTGLLSQLDSLAVKFVARIPVGNLRLGFSDATILDALSVMERGDKSARPLIERAYNVTADIGAIAKKVKSSGLNVLSRLDVKPGIPIRPSLAERVPTAQEIMEKLGPRVAVEQKLDGFRTTIHVWEQDGKKEVALFSRNLENTTSMFPEIVAAAKKLPVENVILDGETIGYNPKTGKFIPFQETVQRKRKYDIEAMAKKIPLATFVFDILYLNGKSLLELPFAQRRTILEKTIGSQKGAVKLADQKIAKDANVIEQELEQAVKTGLEGLVIKNLALPYEAGSRGFHWVKFKATTAALEEKRAGGAKKGAGLLDTIDCLVMGAYRGKGRRTTFGIGGFLLGMKGTDSRYYTISKLGTGLSDEQLREAKKRVETLKAKEMPGDYVVVKEEIPDIWVRPSLVVEVLADEITLSPRHTAGRIKDRGYSLRFPRLVRFRGDKNPEDATTVAEIKKMYSAQKSTH